MNHNEDHDDAPEADDDWFRKARPALDAALADWRVMSVLGDHITVNAKQLAAVLVVMAEMLAKLRELQPEPDAITADLMARAESALRTGRAGDAGVVA